MQLGGTMISVKKINETTFQVTVGNGSSTKHMVTLSPSDYERLSGGKVKAEVLIERSFEFLLERESNTSILSSFDLPIIGSYFPEYMREIKGRL